MAQLELSALYRQAHMRALHEEKRTAELSFSSEEPVERWFGIEILDHSRDSVRLDRLRNGGPLLADHDAADVIGRVEDVHIANGKGRATVRFGNSARASEMWQDVKDGIRETVSVGYRVFKAELEESTDSDLDTFRITDWMPIEISLVSVPADMSVGIGRSQDETNILEITNMSEKTHMTRSERRRSNHDTSGEIERVRVIREVGKQCDERELAEEYIAGGASVELFQKAVLERMKTDTYPNAKIFGDDIGIGMTGREVSQYSFCRAIMAMVEPEKAARIAGYELECSRATEKQFGISREGMHVPPEVLRQVVSKGQRDLSVGTAADGGHTVATDLLGGSFIEILRKSSVVRAAGATVLTGLQGNVAIPRQTATSTAYWIAEAASPTESQQAFDQVTLSPETVGAFTDFSRKLILQSSLDVEAFVRGDLAKKLSTEIDRVSINGSGAGNEPQGILGTAGIGDVAGGVNGLAPAHSHIVELESDVAVSNALMGSLAYITNFSASGKLKQTLLDAGSGRFLLEKEAMNDHETWLSNNVPNDLTKGTSVGVCSAIIFGNWSDLLIGEWGGLSLLVDPYTFSTSGTVRVVALQDIDVNVRHPESFSAMQDALTT